MSNGRPRVIHLSDEVYDFLIIMAQRDKCDKSDLVSDLILNEYTDRQKWERVRMATRAAASKHAVGAHHG